jgi:hypothetical protein
MPVKKILTMISTVHIDRQGYVIEVFQNTRKAALDARRYEGKLLEAEGDICVGWSWDGQRFVLPPPRVLPEAVRAERDKRIDTPFPKRFRDQVTALGGDNALKISTYASEVMRVAESMMDDAPQDYRDDRYWPKVPKLADLAVPQRVSELAPSPVNVTVAPVIHMPAVETKAAPLLVEHRTVSDSVPAVSVDEYGLDRSDPLYPLKVALVHTIEETVDRHGDSIPAEIRGAWEDQLAEMAAIATAAQSKEAIAVQEDRVAAFVEGKAA